MWQRTLSHIDEFLQDGNNFGFSPEPGIHPDDISRWMIDWRIVFKLFLEVGIVPQAVGKWIQRDSWASRDPLHTLVVPKLLFIYLPRTQSHLS
jgi:hypothetical protein